jgi:hypothetical protein
MHKDGDLKDGVRINLHKLDLVMMKETKNKFTGGKSKSAGEEGKKHHNLISIGCGDVFPFRQSPLGHLMVRKKSIGDQFEDLILTRGGFFGTSRDGRRPWCGGREPEAKIRQCREEDGMCEKGGEMAAALRNG